MRKCKLYHLKSICKLEICCLDCKQKCNKTSFDKCFGKFEDIARNQGYPEKCKYVEEVK